MANGLRGHTCTYPCFYIENVHITVVSLNKYIPLYFQYTNKLRLYKFVRNVGYVFGQDHACEEFMQLKHEDGDVLLFPLLMKEHPQCAEK